MSDFATEDCSEYVHADALERAIRNAEPLNIQITFDLGKEHATYSIHALYFSTEINQGQTRATYTIPPRKYEPFWITERKGQNYRKVEKNIAQALRNLLCDARPIKIVGMRAGAKNIKIPLSQLRTLVLRAWCEAAGLEEPVSVINRIESTRVLKNAMRARILADLHNDGGTRFSKRPYEDVKFANHLRNCDLSHLDLSGVSFGRSGLKRFIASSFEQTDLSKSDLGECVINHCNFRNANLEEAVFESAKAVSADFSGAKLRAANFERAILLRAKFSHAQLQEVDFSYADLSGADLTSAVVTDAKFHKTGYDENTRWPEGFLNSIFSTKTASLKNEDSFKLLGKGKDPLAAHEVKLIAKKRGYIDFDRLMKRLQDEFYETRLRNALNMLQAERFQLFVELMPGSLVGVIKSQADPLLIYSCRLTETGAFSCCTQNLARCDGMRGLLCKHILVLLLGVTKAGAIDPATACEWVLTSRKRRPKLDKEIAADTFLRYKGAEAGEIDWRPTETIPEDYYAY